VKIARGIFAGDVVLILRGSAGFHEISLISEKFLKIPVKFLEFLRSASHRVIFRGCIGQNARGSLLANRDFL